jgi:hypothetical protein
MIEDLDVKQIAIASPHEEERNFIIESGEKNDEQFGSSCDHISV